MGSTVTFGVAVDRVGGGLDLARRRHARKAHALRAARGKLLNIRRHLLRGWVIPAHPLALTARRRLDEQRQAALTRYYIDAGAGGIAVGVHTTQFAIREREARAPASRARAGGEHGARLAAAATASRSSPESRAILVRQWPRRRWRVTLGYHAGLVSLGALRDATDAQLVRHCRRIAEVIPVFGFYLQPAVGGRVLGWRFWRELAEVPGLVAIKIAPFNRYATLDVVRAVADSGRTDIALYTGNDDSIISDLVTPFPVRGRREEGHSPHRRRPAWPVGGVDAARRRAARTRQEGEACGSAAVGRPRRPRSRTRMARSSTPRTGSPDAFREFTKCFGARDCCAGRGASIRTSGCRRGRRERSTA